MDERDEKMNNLEQIAKEIADIETRVLAKQIDHKQATDRLCQIACGLSLDQLLFLDELVEDMLKNVDSDENF